MTVREIVDTMLAAKGITDATDKQHEDAATGRAVLAGEPCREDGGAGRGWGAEAVEADLI